jgi:hypothetical protein
VEEPALMKLNARPHFGATPEQVQQETCLSMVEHLVEAFEGKPLRDRVV